MESPELNKSVGFSNNNNNHLAINDGHKTSIEASDSSHRRIEDNSLERQNRPALTDTRNAQNANIHATVSAFDSLRHQRSESKQNLILLEKDSSFSNLHHASSPVLKQDDSK